MASKKTKKDGTKKVPKKKKPKVCPKEMYKEMVTSMWDGEPTNRLVELWDKQITNLARPLPYAIEENRNDVCSVAMESVMKAAKKFDFNRDNPFNYFTSVAKNGLKEGFTDIKRNYDYNIDAILFNTTS